MSHPFIFKLRRRHLEHWIEEAIHLLDSIDGDPDFEDSDEDFVDEREEPGRILGGIGA